MSEDLDDTLNTLLLPVAQARSGSGPRGMERLSMNPIGTIMGAIQTAVEHVAHSGDGLKHVVTQCAPPLHGTQSCQRSWCKIG